VVAVLAISACLAGVAVADQLVQTGGAEVFVGSGPTQPDYAVAQGTISLPTKADYYFLYGTDPNMLNGTARTASQAYVPNGQPQTVSGTLGGLSPNTTYYYELQAVYNGGATLSNGGVRSFTTPGGGSGPPTLPDLGGLLGSLLGALTALLASLHL
jgi:hypothetical protein